MTPEEAKDILEMLKVVHRYIDVQTISYDKKVALDTMYKLINACQEACWEEE